jgi:F-type H+-transporting ATPase subunit gamma
MAAGQERILRRKIRSVEATKKITRAMELIAASQIAKATARIAASKPYQEALGNALKGAAKELGPAAKNLIRKSDPDSPRILIVIVADRGLCGGYNTAVLRHSERHISKLRKVEVPYFLISVGKKAQSYFKFRSIHVNEKFLGISDKPAYEDAVRISDIVLSKLEEFPAAEIISTRYLSAATQRVEIKQLVPLLPISINSEDQGPLGSADLEPDGEDILSKLLPQYIESSIYAALLEAAASEHTARQRAMSSATENAEELIKTYVRQMNRARQESITTEIMEIVGGAEALRAAADTGEE